VKHYSVHFQPDDLTAVIHEGATLLEAAEQAGLILTTPCGGAGRCGKCKVHLLPAGKEVLACRFTVHHNLEISIPDSSRFFRQQILEHGIRHQANLEPSVRKIHLKGPFQGTEAFCNELSALLDCPLVILDETNSLLDEWNWRNADGTTAIIVYRQMDGLPPEISCYCLTAVEQGDTSDKLYGLAVDIGTTTVVARLVDLRTADNKATASCGNPQVKFGADVISRITHSEKENGQKQLNESILSCLNELIEKTSVSASIQKSDIYEVVAAGNTTMNHLLLKYPVSQLGQAPYRAYSLLPANRRPSDMGLQINPAGNIHTIANIAGFVGSDTVAAALACQLDASDEGTLLVDIGTNGEIVLAANKHMFAASCAAGPALEGAGITFGSRAQIGAIERVLLNDEQIDVDVIGGVNPSSLCGSGLIDAAAVLLKLGIIHQTGRFLEPDELDPCIPKKIRNRLIKINDNPAFVLTGELNGRIWENAVYLTQKDIRQFQLAKAAIHAGIQLLLRKAGLQTSDIHKLLLAGAFGNYIQKENAVYIGLLPQMPLERIHFVGNAAGTGAEMVLISRQARESAMKLAKEIQYLEIAHQIEFQTVFSESLLFPEK
jgi:uncharacterized 2Fe-2S/4Fe-4S cluster protein (DUF4445 family)